MKKTYFIQTFGCAQNSADSQRLASMLESSGMVSVDTINKADEVYINTCMIREMAENRIYGLINNLQKTKDLPQSLAGQRPKTKIILTGCMVGMALKDKTGKYLKILKKRMPAVDVFLSVEEIGFDRTPIRQDKTHALVPVSSGCNNFCTYCVVPYTRGREKSRPYDEILEECKKLANTGFTHITLLGMNVNSYGADFIGRLKKRAGYTLSNGRIVQPIYVKHLGRLRIPTLFPYLLDEVCKIEGIQSVDFMSSNPWDFSDELIKVIANNKKISRSLHIAIQSGSNSVLKRMNRWYTKNDLLKLFGKLKSKIKNIQLSTDIIVGFCAESDEEFQDTIDICKKIGFYKAYVSLYSDRPMTVAHKSFDDNITHTVKKKRWQILENLINKPYLQKQKIKPSS
jgi:tRNA-2-methylthio-N6-dimethylallyladenosine synthase